MSRTRNQLISQYLKPLLSKYYPIESFRIDKREDSLDVSVLNFGSGLGARVTYEELRDRMDIAILTKIDYIVTGTAKVTDYLDGRLHIPKPKSTLEALSKIPLYVPGKCGQVLAGKGWADPPEPISKRLDDAVLEYAKALCVEIAGKGESKEAFLKLRTLYVEIQAMEDRCN